MLAVHTRDTMSDIYLDALKIRNLVFVKEQGVPLSREIDQNEALAIHFVLYEENQPLATLRLLPVGKKTVKLQRMAVIKTQRKKGLGAFLIQEAEKFAATQGYQKMILGAQLTAKEFYEALKFQPEGEIFTDAGMPHITMAKELQETI